MPSHLVVGATGPLAHALVLELLASRPDGVCCVLPAANRAAAQARLERGLADAAADFGITLPPSWLARAVAHAADPARPALGLDADARVALAAHGPLSIWHLTEADELGLRRAGPHAAAPERARLHLAMTTAVLELVRLLPVHVFNHLSSAYLADHRDGEAREELSRPRGFLGLAEWAQDRSEDLVVTRCRQAGVPYRVLRPGIVVGHSRTLRGAPKSGLVSWALQLAALEQIAGHRLAREPLRLVADAAAPVSLIPIDAVIEDCLAIDAAGVRSHDQVFHLTSTTPPSFAEVAHAAAGAAGIQQLELVSREDELDLLSRRFHAWSRFHRVVARGPVEFSRQSSATRYDSPRGGRCPLPAADLAGMLAPATTAFRAAGRLRIARKIAAGLWEAA